jgi:hypothetical protein
MLSNIKEVKQGRKVLGVALEGNRRIFAETDDVISVPRADALFSLSPSHTAPDLRLLRGKGERLRHRQAEKSGKIRHGGIRVMNPTCFMWYNQNTF